MKKGLILEGGAMRGMFTAGVMDVLMENNIEFDGAIGVSAGACFGCNYKSRQIGRVIRYNSTYCTDPRYCSFRSLLKTGDLYGADFCYHKIPDELDPFDKETYNLSPMEFYVVCTDVTTGEAVYHKCETTEYTDLEWIRASASMPLVSRIVPIDNYLLLDGGISDSIPIKYFQSIGYDRNIIVLTQPRGYRKEKNKALPLMRITLRAYPHFLQAVANRHNIYNETLDYIWQQEKEGNVLVLCPQEKLPINRIEKDPDVLKQVYQMGRNTAQQHIQQIIEFLH
ncbi:MAG: patatin family protein [Clostridia bacterium]|nr:patatin family protein [Clostridia bacterium]